jgi:hypothetical protein
MFSWLRSSWPGTDAVLDGFERPKLARLRLERFPRGVDNYHIDVAMGPALLKASAAYVKALVRENVQHLWKQPVQAFSESVVQAFRHVIVEHHNAVVKQARNDNRLERVQLFELALLKLLLDQVDNELSALRMELEDARSMPARQLNGQSLHFHQQAVVLARQSWHVRYRVARQIMRELMRVEHSRLRKVRKAVLGISWPLPELMLVNPLLQLEGAGDPRDFSGLYPMLLHDSETATRVNRCVLELLSEWLPAVVQIPPAELPTESFLPGVNRQDQSGTRSLLETERRVRHMFVQSELNDFGTNWMDEPDNACALLGGQGADWPGDFGWRLAGMAGLQRNLNQQLGRRLAQAGLLAAVKASYELSAIYPALGLLDSEVLLYEYLKGDVSRPDMKRRLGAIDGVADPNALLRRVEQLRKDFRRKPEAGQRQSLARFIGDFLRLRRDLKFAWRALVGMDSIRLLDDERDQALALENQTLQLFCREDLSLGGRGAIIGHVILKIDVRGASEIATQMRRRNMNPASHFSRYFYDPITRNLERFAAQKVAVEGDSVMLALLEYGSETAERMAVARACCLGMKIVEFIDGMNAENERVGLPPIEIGIGISYADEAPTYLYDHGRKVTISPAINHARRLSSCHSLLRENCPIPGGRGLCVAAPVHGEGEANETLVRYNVDGIELDATAFAQLHVELSMRRLSARDKALNRPEVLHAGTCADTHGENHLLVVRERRIKLWMGRQLLDANEDGRRYYEILTDPQLLARVAGRLASEEQKKATTAPGARHLQGGADVSSKAGERSHVR